MKKVILLAFIAVLSIASANAQVKFGVTAGLNTSSLTGDVEGGKYKAGVQAGLLLDYSVSDKFSIIPELLFTQKGAKVEESDEYLNLTIKGAFNFNYLQIPINAAYKFDVAPDSKILVFAGPYVGYALSGKLKFDSNLLEDIKINFGSKEGELNPLDFGLNIGAGYQYTKFFAKLQYNLGLSNLSNESDVTLHHSNVAFTVGYLF
ncbi:hypothetical protein FACS189432_03760 [Bacteroidia bacterium]|nr:hypothetical protein FACS189426_23900 [Bacteroidia bacterium]GHT27372.1 hypothetical protein FACS189432_03760 [Bacteroidia bacterium]